MSKFNFVKTDIPEVQIIEPTVFGDDRGYFCGDLPDRRPPPRASTSPFVQDNQSRSTGACCAAWVFPTSTPRASWCA